MITCNLITKTRTSFKTKKSQFFTIDLIVGSTLFFVLLTLFLTTRTTTTVLISNQESKDIITFLSSTKVQNLNYIDDDIEETLGTLLKERKILPETTLPELIIILFEEDSTSNKENLTNFLEQLFSYLSDEYSRFGLKLELYDSSNDILYEYPDGNDQYLNSKEYSSSSIVVTTGNLEEVYGPMGIRIITWKKT